MNDVLLLATEGVEGLSPDHIASDLAVPLGLLIFSGSVFALLWSNYGARKGALIYGVALFGFNFLIGVFWWFGAPGTPVATGLQNFPGQPGDQYQAKWFPFEGGSERSEFFDLWRNINDYQSVEVFAGTTDEEDPFFASVRGDIDGASGLMIDQYFPRSENGSLQIGASLRTELQEATDAASAEVDDALRFEGWVTEVAGNSEASQFDEPQLFVAVDEGQRTAAAVLETYAVWVDPESGQEAERVSVRTVEWFAYKDPGALWFPSAVWTLISFLGFALSLFGLDRVEQREKQEQVEAEEPMDVQVPIAQ